MNALPALVALALLCRSPFVSPARAAYHASAIVYVAGADTRIAATLLVNGRWESGWGEKFEACQRAEKGGWGTYGIASLWEPSYPGATCGPIGVQALASTYILWRECGFFPDEARRGFACYIGVPKRPYNAVAVGRAAEYWATLETLRTASCQ